MTTATAPHGSLMDTIYRRQRHIYDASRKYYLLGRDPMLAALDPPAGGSVLEVACGTARNLIHTARLYPTTSCAGFDISREMLATARETIERAGLSSRITVAEADATAFDPQALFGRPAFDRVFLSYCISMIPVWREALDEALRVTAPGGSVHVVDFGSAAGFPGVYQAGLKRWLASFHVTPRLDLPHVAAELGEAHGAHVTYTQSPRGYVQTAVLKKPSS
ncbi:MAG: class I SAM-dependent methyltransferase [Pseudomonadota bacterium]